VRFSDIDQGVIKLEALTASNRFLDPQSITFQTFRGDAQPPSFFRPEPEHWRRRCRLRLDVGNRLAGHRPRALIKAVLKGDEKILAQICASNNSLIKVALGCTKIVHSSRQAMANLPGRGSPDIAERAS
jgi:hypothetical protein